MKKFIPKPIWSLVQPVYHWLMAFLSAVVYGSPSKEIRVVGITGTKGKTTTAELLNAVLEKAGYKTAVAGTLRFKIADNSEPNMYKMTMPGRFFIQRFIRRAIRAGCDLVILEMTSEGAKQFRHKWIHLDALIFTNLAAEHIESHGSYEKYREAKLKLADLLSRSSKNLKHVVVNADDPEHAHFLDRAGQNSQPIMFSLADAAPYIITDTDITFTFQGAEMTSGLVGSFNLSNILAALSYADAIGVPTRIMKQSIADYKGTRGRVEEINESQPFKVIVDYAHTPDSLEKLYKAFSQSRQNIKSSAHTETSADKQDRYTNKAKLVCVLGNAGGGRDIWKRKEMGQIADQYCDEIILTDEDPYDEDPRQIVEQMKEGIRETPCEIDMNRRSAIHGAFLKAQKLADKNEVSVLITGKGTDPYIMGPNDTKTPWDDAQVAREELRNLGHSEKHSHETQSDKMN